MAVSTNGRARAHDVLELGSLIPETRAVSIVRDGATVMLAAYPKGPRCTIRILAGVAAASRTYFDRIRELAIGDGRIRDEDQRLAMFEQMADLLCAVIPGLEQNEADVLAADEVRAKSILASLGWWKRADGTRDEEDAEDEDTDPTLTRASAGSYQGSPPSTEVKIGSQ